jgi:hypothetical protein
MKAALRVVCLIAAIALQPGVAHARTTSFTFEQQGSDPARGESVRVGGHVEGTSNCMEDRKIRIQRRAGNSDEFHTITATRTNSEGNYHRSIIAHKTKQYRAVATARPRCGKQESETITIRVRKKDQ